MWPCHLRMWYLKEDITVLIKAQKYMGGGDALQYRKMLACNPRTLPRVGVILRHSELRGSLGLWTQSRKERKEKERKWLNVMTPIFNPIEYCMGKLLSH